MAERFFKVKRLEESRLREALERCHADIIFSSIFGSCRRGEEDSFSDLDILILCEDERDKALLNNLSRELERAVHRRVHLNLFTSCEAEDRIRRHDYLLASILDDSAFLLGDEDSFFKFRRRALSGMPDSDSIEFNKVLGKKILRRAEGYLNSPTLSRQSLLKGLMNYKVALGYLIASMGMERYRRILPMRRLLETELGRSLEYAVTLEKHLKRGRSINIAHVRSVLANRGALRDLLPP